MQIVGQVERSGCLVVRKYDTHVENVASAEVGGFCHNEEAGEHVEFLGGWSDRKGGTAW